MFPSKGRNRTIVSPKDTYVLGPQFTVQASSVAERPSKQRDLTGLKTNDLLSASNLGRRSASSSVDGSGSALGQGDKDLTSHRSSGQTNHRVINTTHGKRHALSSTAPSHDTSPGNHSAADTSVASSHHQTALSDQRASSSTVPSSRGHQGSSVFLPDTVPRGPGDRVVFAESPSAPGIPIVYRTPDERSVNPDRLNLDRRRLAVCPILEGEDQLRLLNYQHNSISKIQRLSGLKRLIFLDLYDNHIEDISGLSVLKSLRVLMLGKNRIQKIENLDSLTKLDVLDLHGNEIMHIENLNHLSELRVLNLAGNMIEHVDNLTGMDALTELNLRRNRIRTVVEVDALPNLQRLFLSFNEITCFEDIQCLGDSTSLAEVSLDGNPFAQESHYKQIVIRYMQQLRQLDMKRVSDDERRIASVMARKEEEKRKETNKIAVMKEKKHLAIRNAKKQWETSQGKSGHGAEPRTRPLLDLYLSANHSKANIERRRLAISNARRQWEVMQGSMMSRTNHIAKNAAARELYANHVGNVPNSEVNGEDDKVEKEETVSARSSNRLSRPTSAKSVLSDKDWQGSGVGAKSTSRTPSRSSSVSVGGTPEKEKGFSAPGGSSGSLNVDFLSELDGDTLSMYGSGALDSLDKNWGIQAAGAVTTICFKFIDFDEISKVLHKIRVRFPNVHSLIFNSTNIRTFSQLNALSAVRRLDSIVVENDGNPITKFLLWRTYLLFRLAHFCLKKINDTEVSASDIVNAEKFFGTLAHMTTSQLPQSRLLALLGEKKKQLLADEKSKKAVGEGGKLTDRTTESVGRAGLVYAPAPDTGTATVSAKPQEPSPRHKFVRNYVKELAYDSIQMNQKHSALQKVWSQIFTEMVQTAVVDMWDTNTYMKKCMDDLEKS